MGTWCLKDIGLTGRRHQKDDIDCIMGNVGSSISGAWTILETKSNNIAAFSASILTIHFINLSLVGVVSAASWKSNTKLLMGG